MSIREHLSIERLHHAYLVEGEQAVLLPELLSFFDASGIPSKGNPDFHLAEHDAFLLDHAHELRRLQSMHAAGLRKIFVIAFNTMLSEAQNALLKTLEEPTAGTHFFFLTRTSEILLPTVRSRMQIIKDKRQTTENKEQHSGEAFLKASLPERLKMTERFTKAKADEKGEAKEGARVFLESLERALSQNIFRGDSLASGATKFSSRSSVAENGSTLCGDVSLAHASLALHHVISAKRYLSDRSPSLKLLLEHLALTLPKIVV